MPPSRSLPHHPVQRLPLEDAAEGYRNFKQQQDSWTKVVLKPGMAAGA